jgi:hypothetical protein
MSLCILKTCGQCRRAVIIPDRNLIRKHGEYGEIFAMRDTFIFGRSYIKIFQSDKEKEIFISNLHICRYMGAHPRCNGCRRIVGTNRKQCIDGRCVKYYDRRMIISSFRMIHQMKNSKYVDRRGDGITVNYVRENGKLALSYRGFMPGVNSCDDYYILRLADMHHRRYIDFYSHTIKCHMCYLDVENIIYDCRIYNGFVCKPCHETIINSRIYKRLILCPPIRRCDWCMKTETRKSELIRNNSTRYICDRPSPRTVMYGMATVDCICVQLYLLVNIFISKEDSDLSMFIIRLIQEFRKRCV